MCGAYRVQNSTCPAPQQNAPAKDLVKAFWIVTPSYNQAEWLRLCIASVRDQVGGGAGRIRVHHHVQDAHSSDNTLELLATHERAVSPAGYSFSYCVQHDGGMYDAINRGWRAAPPDADYVAHLNCDEQYLPGALQRVAEAFSGSSELLVLLADLIVVDQQGTYVCHRRSLKPYRWLSRFCCAGFTASTFQSRQITQQKEVYFDTSWRNIGDKVWYNALYEAGVKFQVLNEPVAIFTDTGENLNWTESGQQERERYAQAYQGGWQQGSAWVARVNAVRRAIKERHISPPDEYHIYTQSSPGHRVRFSITNPTGHWHKRWPARKTT